MGSTSAPVRTGVVYLVPRRTIVYRTGNQELRTSATLRIGGRVLGDYAPVVSFDCADCRSGAAAGYTVARVTTEWLRRWACGRFVDERVERAEDLFASESAEAIRDFMAATVRAQQTRQGDGDRYVSLTLYRCGHRSLLL